MWKCVDVKIGKCGNYQEIIWENKGEITRL
jgi:hypothetical protein